jgi:hypothetical protein
MRQPLLCLSLVAALLFPGCNGDADLSKSGEDVRKDAAKMSDSELETRMKELEAKGDALQKSVGDKEPSEDQMKEMTKIMEVMGIYATELAKRKMNK